LHKYLFILPLFILKTVMTNTLKLKLKLKLELELELELDLDNNIE